MNTDTLLEVENYMKQLSGDAAKYVDSKPVDDIILSETTLGILSIMGDIAGDEKPHLKGENRLRPS